ncbi:MAG: response regulator, partial [Limisphaerales bacterium]
MAEHNTIFLTADQSHMLLLEDDPAAKEYLESVVASFGFRIEHAATVAAAHRAMERRRFQIIVMDLSLPDGNGSETFDAIRVRSGNTPIIVLTEMEDEKLARELTGRGAHDYLVKSRSNPAMIENAVERALELRRTQKELSKEKVLL